MQETIAFTPQIDASSITQWLWLIPAVPIVASGVIAVLKQPRRKLASSLAIGSLGISLLIAIAAFAHVLSGWSHGHAVRETVNFTWLQVGTQAVELGWVLDPLSAVMLVMVTFVGLLIFIYSTGYMAHDENYTRFFCFLSLFAGAMLGRGDRQQHPAALHVLGTGRPHLVSADRLLVPASPRQRLRRGKRSSRRASATSSFCLESSGSSRRPARCSSTTTGQARWNLSLCGGLLVHHSHWGLTAAGAIGLLIFAGAAGKSGQLPLHVWLPDAMEGPTPVSALIHAATMVAAGVYLVARVYPLMSAGAVMRHGRIGAGARPALIVVTWVGASTAVFAALIAVAQNDIKRILAYSTVSQLGYMMAGLGMGGVAVGMFHLITHAFFKALLFMGAGSVIHGATKSRTFAAWAASARTCRSRL